MEDYTGKRRDFLKGVDCDAAFEFLLDCDIAFIPIQNDDFLALFEIIFLLLRSCI